MSFLCDIQPRIWQQNAFSQWVESLRGIARVVTGGGKTVFSYLCVEEFFSRYPNGKVIIIVPTVALMDQWYVDIIDATKTTDDDVACYSGSGHAEYARKINIVVLNTARTVAPRLSSELSTPSFLIVDECHRAGSPENAKALIGDYVATLGLSATPERENDDGFDKRIVPALGPVVFEYDYREARLDGVIVDFDLINVEIDASNTTVFQSALADQQALLTSVDPDILADGIQNAIGRKAAKSATAALRVPWAIRLALMHANERIIIFHERIQSLQLIVDMLTRFGHNSLAYHSNLSAAHRRDNLRLFRRGEIDTLVTCRALDEGANVPEANVAIVARSTSSTRQRIQRLGRVLRPAKQKDHAVVYTLYSGPDERKRLSQEASGLHGVAATVWRTGVAR